MDFKTSLAQQLEKLKVPQTSVHKERYGSVSFIYDFVEAKTIDIETHFSNAIFSLKRLIQIDPYFKKYEETLFHESSKKFDRGLETLQKNQELNELIDEFLFRISKYFQLSDTHKVLEYMIQKYQIHQYNVDSLIASVLPYHETRMFIRLIQTCPAVKNPREYRFFWMKKYQENGVPLTKSILIKHCLSDIGFTHFVTHSIFKGLNFDPENAMFPSFLASFCLNLIQHSLKEKSISHILSVITDCLKSDNPNLYIVSLMITCHLCNLNKIETKIIEKILKYFSNKLENSESTLTSYEIIVKSQKISVLPQSFIKGNFPENLIRYSNNLNLEFLAKALFFTILTYVEKEKYDVEQYKNYLSILLGKYPSEKMIKDIVKWINRLKEQTSEELLIHVAQILEKSFPIRLNVAISSLDSMVNLTKYFKSVRFSVVDETQIPLCIGLKHRDKNILRKSLDFFAKSFPTLIENVDHNDAVFIKQIFLEEKFFENFNQKEKVEILLKILDVRENIFKLLTIEEFEKYAIDQIEWIEAIQTDDNNELNQFLHLKQLLIEIYSTRPYQDYNHEIITTCEKYIGQLFSDKMQQIFLINLLSYDSIFINNMLQSKYCQTNPLFQIIHDDLSNQSGKICSPDGRKILNMISKYLNDNIDSLFFKSNLLQSIRPAQELEPKFILLVLYSVIKMLEIHPLDLCEERVQIVCQFAVDLMFDLLASIVKISAYSEIQVDNVDQYSNLDMDQYFLSEFVNFDNQNISLLITGYIIHCLIKQVGSSDDLPSTLDWYLTDVTQFISFDFSYKIYCLLIYYSTPKENKAISKKVYKFFRHLMASFLLAKVTNNGWKFFLPSIVDQDSEIQKQTLVILNNLLQSSPLNSTLISYLESNNQFLICYLLALNSNKIGIRQLALSNLKTLASEAPDDFKLKHFIEELIKDEQSILMDKEFISISIDNIYSQDEKKKYTIIEELVDTVIFILTADQSKVKSKYRVLLMRLLKNCNSNVKSTIFCYYSNFLFSSNVDRIITREQSLELKEIISFYKSDLSFEITKEFLDCLLKCIEKFGNVLTEDISFSIIDLLSPGNFQNIIALKNTYALKIVHSLLKKQLELSEKQSTSAYHSNLINKLQLCIRKLMFDCDFIVELINELLPIKDIHDNFTEAPKEKRFKMDDTLKKKFTTDWKLFRIFISILSNVENFDCSCHLIKNLFDYLKLTFMDVDDNSSELTRKIILYAIVNCVEAKFSKKSNNSKPVIHLSKNIEINDVENQKDLIEFIDKINVDTIIDCMLESKIKETQRLSLILINLIAPYFREQIIEYLVTIFTFIGSNLLDCDDQYSLAILFETMESIIPIILRNEDDNGNNSKRYIISVFIKSFSHIPVYRRLPLFTKLIELLGPEDFLSYITASILIQISQMESETEKKADTSILHQLFAKFSIKIQLKSICLLICLFERRFLDNHFRDQFQKKLNKSNQSFKFYSALIKNDRTEINSLVESIKSFCKNFEIQSVFDPQKVSIETLKFILELMSSPEFIEEVRALEYSVISSMLIYLLNIILRLVILLNYGGSKSSLNIYRKQMKLILDQIFHKYNSLIPKEKLLDIVLIDLLNNTAQMEPVVSILITRKALELLNEKLALLKANEVDLDTVSKIIMNLFEHLQTHHQNIKNLDEHQIHNLQLILLSTKSLTKFLNSDSIAESKQTKTLLSKVISEVIQMTKSIDELIKNSPSKLLSNLKSSCILCLTQIMSTMALEAIAHLSDVVNLILENFETKEDIVVISNVSALYKMIINFAKFLSPHLKSIIFRLLPIFSLCDTIVDLRSKLNKLWISIAKLVPKRTIFDAIDSIYDIVLTTSPKSMVELMNLFKLSCGYIEKADVEMILKSFKDFMLKALNFRSLKHSEVDSSLIELIETSVCDSFAAFVPKLTESNFRPIYYSLLEWAIHVDQYKSFDDQNKLYTLPDECFHRMISFYRFCSFLADRLKSLFCVFIAPTIIQNCSQILLSYHSDLSEKPNLNDSSKEIFKIKDSEIGEKLVVAILSTIAKCFLYDLNGTFVNNDCTSLILRPIVNQITNFNGNEEQYQTRLDLILQCTQYLIQNNKDETLIKDFNYQILLKTRDSNEKSKLSAIKVLHRLILTCNEDYLPFIPEAMPFIAELSEDDSELVENQLKELISDLELLIGEPINKYF